MSNRIVLDSSVLIEYRKGAKLELLEALVALPDVELCICQVIASEYLFHHLAIFGEKSPRTLKENNAIGNLFSLNPPMPFLEDFIWLEDNPGVLAMAVKLMEHYNLLPNDAFILSICKLHGVNALTSYDVQDFEAPCRAEGIDLIQNVEGLINFMEK